MQRLLFLCWDAALAALVMIPLFVLLNWLYFRNLAKTLCCFLFAVYLSAMFSVVGLPSVIYVRFDPNVNWSPFAYMFSDWESSLLNVLLFVPLGFFLPFLWSYFRRLQRTLLFGMSTSALIEILQLFTYRATDINDLITNTVGTLAGWILARCFLGLFRRFRPYWRTGDVFLLCGISFGVMFFIHPFLAGFLHSLF